MEKLVYLLHASTSVPGPDLRSSLVEKAEPELRAAGATQVTVAVADEDVAAGEGIAIRKSEVPLRAMVSFWLQTADDRAACEEAMAARVDSIEGYLVAESRPLVYQPPVGERCQGASLVTCIRKRADISQEEFFDRWNIEHRQVALEIQSTFTYVRNAVVRTLTADARAWDGIVEEGFPIEALTNPQVWYDCDSEEEYRKRLRRMIDSVNAFLDLERLESVPMSEYYLG